MNSEDSFHNKLKKNIHAYVLLTYQSAKKYPDDEHYGLVSQDRRAAVSIMLNYVEGYARIKPAVMINMLETSYASLKESIYVRFLAMELGYINQDEYQEALKLKEEIGAMLYATIDGLKRNIQ